MKKNYIKPVAEIVDFDVKDLVMTASEEDDLVNDFTTDESVSGGFFDANAL